MVHKKHVRPVHTLRQVQVLVRHVEPEKYRLKERAHVRYVKQVNTPMTIIHSAYHVRLVRSVTMVHKKHVRLVHTLRQVQVLVRSVLQVRHLMYQERHLHRHVRNALQIHIHWKEQQAVLLAARISGLTQEQVHVRIVPKLMLPAIYGT